MRAPVASAPRHFISPQLATLVDEPPSGPEWVFEIKYDGYRIQAVIRNGRVALLTRRGLDWTHRFPEIAEAMQALAKRRRITVAVLDRGGKSSFRLLQQYFESGSRTPIVFYAFDVLRLRGVDLRERTLKQRRVALTRILGATHGPLDLIRISEVMPGGGARLLTAACKAGLEGIIGKRLDAPYESGRARSWVKVKCEMRQEFVIVGFTLPRGTRKGIGALLLAVHEGRGRTDLRFAGAVGTGFSHELLRELRAVLEPRVVKRPPFPGGATPAAAPRDARWVRPNLLAEVSFTEWTAEGVLRHPSFQGLREDKAARDIIQESPMDVAGVTISHPDRIVYPGTDITKVDVARYYERIARRMLPHVANRPMAFLRCPEGIKKECFFQKHVGKGIGEAVDQVRIRSKDGTSKDYAVVRDVAGLISLIQFGILEIHLWGCRDDAVEKPDRVVFDLDPDPSVDWDTTVEAALLIRKRLTKLGLKSWPKTTGGKGVHVVLPIDRRVTWDEVRAFSRVFAEDLAAEYPHDFVSAASKAARKGRIFIDWMRNGRGSTWIAPWSTRAREGATISVPISWKTLESLDAPAKQTVATIADAAKLGADPWAAMLTTRQSLKRV
jgi:bifunctional non-homologous end joining protein LigD